MTPDLFLSLGPAKGLDRFEHELFVKTDHERPVARVAAMRKGTTGMLGYFEAEDVSVAEMLQGAAQWLREKGATTIIGPMDGDSWHRYRVNAGPWETPPFLLEPVNPPYYTRLWEEAGFEVVASYSSKRVHDVTPLIEKLEPMKARSLSRGYRIRSIDPERLREELTLVWRLSLEIFAGNAFYSDIGLEDFLELYAGIDRLLVPGLVLFAEAADGETAGFLFAYPDSAPGAVNFKTIGVTPKHRRGHVGWALLQQGYTAARNLGRTVANHCLMHEDNASQSMDAGEAVEFRRYLLYHLP